MPKIARFGDRRTDCQKSEMTELFVKSLFSMQGGFKSLGRNILIMRFRVPELHLGDMERGARDIDVGLRCPCAGGRASTYKSSSTILYSLLISVYTNE